MEKDFSVEREKFSARAESHDMTPDAVALNVQGMVQKMAEMSGSCASTKESFNRLSRLTGLTCGQIKRLWYREWSVIPTHIFLSIHAAYRQSLGRAARQAEHQAAVYRALNDEWNDLWDRDSHACASSGSAGEQSAPSVPLLPSSTSGTGSALSLTASNAA